MITALFPRIRLDKMKDLILKSLEENKSKIAYKSISGSITFGELKNKALKLSKLLASQGNEPVILYGHKEPGMIVGIVGCILANRAYVPVDISVPDERVRSIIIQSKASLLLNTGSEIYDVSKELAEDLDRYEGMKPVENNNKTAYIIFTSGSTGQPKGIPVTYDSLKNFLGWLSTITEKYVSDNEVIFNQANYNFDLSVVDLFTGLLRGYTMLGLSKSEIDDYGKLFDKIKRENVSVMVLTPSFLNILMTEPDFDAGHYPSIKLIYLCGETLSKKKALKVLNRFPNITLINAYGPTEAASAVSAVVVTREICEKYDSIPIGEMDNTATDISLEDGEIVLSGPSVFSGYLGGITGGYENRAGVNTYRTGDEGFIKDGFLFFGGRLDYQIKYKGYRIELEEIENVIREIPGVSECVVVPKTDAEENVLFLKAYVTGEIKTSDEIKKIIAEKLPDYMIPKTIRVIEKMPLNANGKTDRKEICRYD